MNRETKRLIEFGKDKKAARAAIRNAAEATKNITSVAKFRIAVFLWLRSQPSSTRKGYYRGNFVLPSYVLELADESGN